MANVSVNAILKTDTNYITLKYASLTSVNLHNLHYTAMKPGAALDPP